MPQSLKVQAFRSFPLYHQLLFRTDNFSLLLWPFLLSFICFFRRRKQDLSLPLFLFVDAVSNDCLLTRNVLMRCENLSGRTAIKIEKLPQQISTLRLGTGGFIWAERILRGLCLSTCSDGRRFWFKRRVHASW